MLLARHLTDVSAATGLMTYMVVRMSSGLTFVGGPLNEIMARRRGAHLYQALPGVTSFQVAHHPFVPKPSGGLRHYAVVTYNGHLDWVAPRVIIGPSHSTKGALRQAREVLEAVPDVHSSDYHVEVFYDHARP